MAEWTSTQLEQENLLQKYAIMNRIFYDKIRSVGRHIEESILYRLWILFSDKNFVRTAYNGYFMQNTSDIALQCRHSEAGLIFKCTAYENCLHI